MAAAIPERDYLLSPEAKKLFQAWQHELTDCSILETHAGLAAVYLKLETYTGRFALLLHCVNATLQQKLPASTVSDATMQRAITLAKYYLSQARLVYGTNDPASLSDKILMQIITLSKKKGLINSRIAKQSIRAPKSYTSNHIRKLFQNLVEMGHGSIEGSSTQIKWHYSASTPEESESKRSHNLEKTSVDNSSNFVDATLSTATITARSHVPAPVTQLVDNVDTFINVSSG
jgi:ribosomal protein L17